MSTNQSHIKSKIKGIIFDVDGTLLDTSEFVYQAFEYILKEFSFPVPDRATLISKTGKKLAVDYEALTGTTDTEKLCAAHRTFQNEHQDLVTPFPHLIETLEELKKRGLWLSIASIRSKITLIKSLEQANILKYFDFLLTAEDVAEPKPHPEYILKTLTHFKVQSDEVLVIGDRAVDVYAGKAVEAKTLAVTYGYEADTVAQAKPDGVVDDFRKVLDMDFL